MQAANIILCLTHISLCDFRETCAECGASRSCRTYLPSTRRSDAAVTEARTSQFCGLHPATGHSALGGCVSSIIRKRHPHLLVCEIHTASRWTFDWIWFTQHFVSACDIYKTKKVESAGDANDEAPCVSVGFPRVCSHVAGKCLWSEWLYSFLLLS